MSKFQMVLTTFFGVFIIVGLVAFAMYRGAGSAKLSPIVIWGTVGKANFDAFLATAQSDEKKSPLNVSYVQVPAEVFESQLVEALASRRGPDVVLLPHDLVLKERERILPIPYASVPERTFKNTFVEGSELYMTPEGVAGVPFIVDPLVLYWNRDLFSAALISQPPRYWSEVSAITPKLTKKDERLNILTSAIALGSYGNIPHAKEIVSALMMQAGAPIIARNGSSLKVDLGGTGNSSGSSALSFFLSFADTAKGVYTWNRAMPNAKDMFIAGDLAMYIGSASELSEIREKNPNLNFDIAMLPQASGKNTKVLTFGTMYGLSVLKMSPYAADAFQSILLLADSSNVPALTSAMRLPPVRRDLLSEPQLDPYSSIFFSSALISHGWQDPDPAVTNKIFGDMVQSTATGVSNLNSAVTRASQQLLLLVQ